MQNKDNTFSDYIAGKYGLMDDLSQVRLSIDRMVSSGRIDIADCRP